MLLKLIERLLSSVDRVLVNTRADIKACRVNKQLIVYRHDGVQFWWDLDIGLRSFCMSTRAEVAAYNSILTLLNDDGRFVKNGLITYYMKGGNLWTSSDWSSSH